MTESPNTYTISIYQDWMPILQTLKSGTLKGKFDFKVLSIEQRDSALNKVNIEVTAEEDNTIFEIGFWLERLREQTQQEHYDLKDLTKLEVEVPAGFLVICNYFELNPSGVLELFSGDLCQHPFITGGSDERWMAKDYFMRGHYAPLGDDDKVEDLFDTLQWIRSSWEGNSKMEAYKKLYAKEMKKLSKRFPGKEVQS